MTIQKISIYFFTCFYLVGVRASSLTIYGKERKPELSKRTAKQIGRKTENFESNNVKRSSDLAYELS